MKIVITGLILLWASVSLSAENVGKVCLHIPERGVELVKIEHACQKGDIIQLNKMHIATLCDFNSAIVNYDGHDQYICAYLGEKRPAREGTNE